MIHSLINLNHLDGPQGAIEARSEAYLKYVEQALEMATPRDAKNTSGSASLDGRQAGVVGKLRRL